MMYRHQQSQWQKFVVVYGVVLTLVFTIVFIFQPTFFWLIGLKAYDSMVRSLPKKNNGIRPIIVDLDEKSLQEFGQWPWPRYRMALLLEKIGDLGASAIALDILFAEEDRTSLHVLQRQLLNDLDVRLSFDDQHGSWSNNDKALAKTLETGPFVLGYNFSFNRHSTSSGSVYNPLDVAIHNKGEASENASTLYTALDVTTNIPLLSKAAHASGYLNFIGDEDGVIRRVPLLMRYNEKTYPSLALATVLQSLGLNSVVMDVYAGNIESLAINGRHIPLDEKGNLLLAYQGRSHLFEYISASDILNGTVDRQRLADKIVLIGTSAAGLQDNHPTPLDPIYPGVEVHATIIENILNGHFLSRPLWSRGAELFSILLFGLASTLFLARSNPITSLLFFSLGSVGSWYAPYLLLKKYGIFLNPTFALLMLIINFAILSLLKYWREEHHLRKRNKELLLSQNTTILSMTALAETRDNETGSHILRTQHYVRALAEELSSHPKFKKELNWHSIDLLFRSAPLHDIGKVGVPDHILLNPDKLTAAEFEQMKDHTRLGHDTLLRAETLLEDDSEHTFLRFAKDTTYCHHEKWDGSGYPRGLRGDEIPIAGRLMALADVYDALVTTRRYKPAIPHEQAVEIIRREKGKHFDPDMVQAFLTLEQSFKQIGQRFRDDSYYLAPPPEPAFATN